MFSLDGAEHQRLRRLAAPAFTPRGAERMRTVCAEVINELVDPLTAAGRCDVVADIATLYPTPILCTLVGAPHEDWQQFTEWEEEIAKAYGSNAAAETPKILRAFEQLGSYVEDMIVRRRESLTDDLVSELIRAEEEGDRLTYDELVDLVVMLQSAGTETVSNQLATAVHTLCDYPDQWALLAENPELAPQAVAELQRHHPVVLVTMRVAKEDVELGGVLIPAGTLVVANMAAANRDAEVYDDPDRLDITREGPAPMSFGGGAHNCLGAHLAKIELAEALKVITRRMPHAHRTGPTIWKQSRTGIRGPVALPLEFDAGH
jgi:cytochrome P450